MIRQIGKGSYGEVWLARAVTGALRAVKVISRADFEYDQTFEREFEGIKKFEPISRKHPGLVDILHVGRNREEGFYYYVMELADDRLTSRDIVPELYVSRTLSSDLREKGQLPASACANWGAVLADGLHHMHQHGLAHRDVKPSNVIFVEGVPKLADIGLVAASGQRTFVGTEGFVPPEGPGDASADIYSLGMVLYEISTGKDRLEFPAVPQLTGDDVEKKKWRRLNTVVCKACAPSPKQRYSNAREMRSALLSLSTGALDPPAFSTKLFRLAVFSGLLAAGLVALRNHDLLGAYQTGNERLQSAIAKPPDPAPAPPLEIAERPPQPPPPEILPPEEIPVGPSVPPPPPDPKFGTVMIRTSPPGAQVFQIGSEGERIDMGTIDLDYVDDEAEPGEVAYELVLDGYETMHVRDIVRAGKVLRLGGQMRFYRPPEPNKNWNNSSGLEFAFVVDKHVGQRPFSPEEFERFTADREDPVDFHRALVVPAGASKSDPGHWTVLVHRQVAGAYLDWLTDRERREGFLGEDQFYSLDETVAYDTREAVFGKNPFEKRVPLFAAVHQAEFATLVVDSEPSGAGIYLGDDEQPSGSTKVTVPRIRPGLVKITVKLAGYRTEVMELDLKPGVEKNLKFVLEESDGVEFGTAWTNSLEMKILPLSGEVMMGAHEVRASDYGAYLSAMAKPVAAVADKAHPVLGISRSEAEAFCEWLTELEREEGLIGPDLAYRLPTDLEWSAAAGLEGETGDRPVDRDMTTTGVFPWGGSWPPPENVANIKLEGFDDGFEGVAPVGSFEANEQGFFDLAGNAREWVAESYGGTSDFKDWGITRGGAYSSSLERHLLSSYRHTRPPDVSSEDQGFRVVLAEQE